MSDNLLPAAPLLSPALWPDAASDRLPADGQRARRAAQDFESVLLHKVMQEMGRTVPESGLLEDSSVRQAMELSWLYLAQELARKGGLGLWKQLCRDLKLEPSPGLAPLERSP